MSRIEDEVARKILARAEFGKKKYQTTMERNDLTLEQWLNNLSEELMDAAVYVEKAMWVIKEAENKVTFEEVSKNEAEGNARVEAMRNEALRFKGSSKKISSEEMAKLFYFQRPEAQYMPNDVEIKGNGPLNRKFEMYWEEIGRPKLEETIVGVKWTATTAPSWDSGITYRIKEDPHWQLRSKWLDSYRALPIEAYFGNSRGGEWYLVYPKWDATVLYREGKFLEDAFD